ncbi:MAG: hypothetical protein LBU64_12345 [Planctomycetota bacterium]|jgi:hypothetical protein|nr:hypothetical protein [Planctomycetota bacterium]
MTADGPVDWVECILRRREPGATEAAVWADIFSVLKTIAEKNASPVVLHDATVTPDSLLAEAAWELWGAYPDQAPKTSEALKRWTNGSAGPGAGKAVLIVDSLSLREMPYLLGAARARGIVPALTTVTGAECPSTTSRFAAELGLPSRAALANDGKPGGFALFNGHCRTDVVNIPFEDCPVPPEPNLVVWHTWLDDLLHARKKAPDAVNKAVSSVFQGDGFWRFVNALRQGRNLVVTSDHGYADGKRFSSEVSHPEDAALLREIFGASRHVAASGSLVGKFMPPLFLEHGGQRVVMGQWKWKVQGGFPQVCHGGLSLLETAVPWIEFTAI